MCYRRPGRGEGYDRSKVTSKFVGGKFWATSELYHEYLRNETRRCRTENGIENRNLSCLCALSLVNFGPQMAKSRTGVSTDLARSRYVGYSFRSSCVVDEVHRVKFHSVDTRVSRHNVTRGS